MAGLPSRGYTTTPRLNCVPPRMKSSTMSTSWQCWDVCSHWCIMILPQPPSPTDNTAWTRNQALILANEQEIANNGINSHHHCGSYNGVSNCSLGPGSSSSSSGRRRSHSFITPDTPEPTASTSTTAAASLPSSWNGRRPWVTISARNRGPCRWHQQWQ